MQETRALGFSTSLPLRPELLWKNVCSSKVSPARAMGFFFCFFFFFQQNLTAKKDVGGRLYSNEISVVIS